MIARVLWLFVAACALATCIRAAAVGDILGAVDGGLCTALCLFLAWRGHFPWEPRL